MVSGSRRKDRNGVSPQVHPRQSPPVAREGLHRVFRRPSIETIAVIKPYSIDSHEARSSSGKNRRLARQLVTPRLAGITNRERCLQELNRLGPTTRAGLARSLGATRGAVSTIMQPFVDQGLIVEVGQVKSGRTGGKPGQKLWFNQDGPRLAGVDVRSDLVSASLMTLDGTILRQEVETYPSKASAIELLHQIITVTRYCLDGQTILGIGVAVSGMVDTETGTIIAMYLQPQFEGLPLGAQMTEQLGVPVFVDHQVRVQALGDLWFGIGKHTRRFASVYTGEVLGFGVVADGDALRGAAGAGGEAGHTVVDASGTVCRCGKTGCWETIATLGWLRHEATRLGIDGAATLTTAKLAAAASNGETGAAGLLDRFAFNLALGMSNNEAVLASNIYIIHGDVCGGGDLFKERLQHWMEQLSPPRKPFPEVVFGRTDETATLQGGGGLVLSHLISGML